MFAAKMFHGVHLVYDLFNATINSMITEMSFYSSFYFFKEVFGRRKLHSFLGNNKRYFNVFLDQTVADIFKYH